MISSNCRAIQKNTKKIGSVKNRDALEKEEKQRERGLDHKKERKKKRCRRRGEDYQRD